MNKKSIFLGFIILIFAYSESYGQGIASVREIVADGSKLESRSALVPFATREDALTGNAERSGYILPVGGWTSETTDTGVRWDVRIKIPSAWGGRAVILRMEDVTSSFKVSMNGNYVGYSQSGIGRTEFDLTGFAQPDYNDISIFVYKDAVAEAIENNRLHDELLFRSATLVSQPMVRIRDIAFGATAEEDRAAMSLGVIVKSHLRNPKDYKISYELLSPGGKVAASGSRELTTGWMSEDTLRFNAVVADPLTWSHEMPYLYKLIIRSVHMGRDAEFVSADVGIRSVGFKAGNLIINGSEIARLTVGRARAAGSEEMTVEQLMDLKKSGIKCVIADGNPQPDYFYTLCDHIGLYVCDMADVDTRRHPRNRTVDGNPSNDPAWEAAYTSRALDMYRSSRLHPSVVMFAPADSSYNGYCLYESYLALKSLEHARPVVYFDACGEWNDDRIEIASPTESVPPRVNPVTIYGGIRPGEVTITNGRDVAPLKGYVIYKVKQGNKIKASGYKKLDVAPRSDFLLDIPETDLAKASKKRSIEILIYTPALRVLPSGLRPEDSLDLKGIATPPLDGFTLTARSVIQF